MKKTLIFLFIIVLLLCGGAFAQTQVNYVIDMPDPANHIFDVTMKFKPADADYTVVVMASCVPGYYKEEYYAKDVQEFSASDENNKPLKWERAEYSSWKIYHSPGQAINVKYRVYSDSGKILLSYLNPQRALINPATVCMYIKDKTSLPCYLTINFPKYWDIATALKETGKNNFYAPNYAVFVDSPIMAGNLKTKKITYKGVDYNLVVDSMIKFDMEKFTPGLEKLIKEQVDTMGGVPFKEYSFMYIIYPKATGGMEHASSCVIGKDPERFDYDYDKLLWVFSHEFFHLWNDKCVFAKNIYPYNYNNPNLTKLYWFFEGFTRYYQDVFAVRSGCMKEKTFFTRTADIIDGINNCAAAKKMLLEDASFTGWYLQAQNKDENSLDFYDKGMLVALVTDLKIRHDSGGKKSLDDVMRYLYENYGLKNTGIGEDELEGIFEKSSGAGLKDIFDGYVRGTKEIDYNKYLNYAGLKLQTKEDEPELYLGIKGNYRNGAVVVDKVEKGSPADKSGICVDDMIIAVNGVKISENDYFAGYKENDKINLSLFRNNMLMVKEVVLLKKGKTRYSIVKTEEPNALQKQILKSWLGEQKGD